MCSGSTGAWRNSACISTWAAQRVRYTWEKDGGTGSLVCACVSVCVIVGDSEKWTDIREYRADYNLVALQLRAHVNLG